MALTLTCPCATPRKRTALPRYRHRDRPLHSHSYYLSQPPTPPYYLPHPFYNYPDIPLAPLDLPRQSPPVQFPTPNARPSYTESPFAFPEGPTFYPPIYLPPQRYFSAPPVQQLVLPQPPPPPPVSIPQRPSAIAPFVLPPPPLILAPPPFLLHPNPPPPPFLFPPPVAPKNRLVIVSGNHNANIQIGGAANSPFLSQRNRLGGNTPRQTTPQPASAATNLGVNLLNNNLVRQAAQPLTAKIRGSSPLPTQALSSVKNPKRNAVNAVAQNLAGTNTLVRDTPLAIAVGD